VALGCNDDVAGLQVAMDDALFVRLFERGSDLAAQRQHFYGGKGTRLQSLRERVAGHILYDEIVRAALLADIIDSSDVGVVKLG